MSSATSSGERRRIWRSFTNSQRTSLQPSVPALAQEPHERGLEIGGALVAGHLLLELVGRAREQPLAVREDHHLLRVSLGLLHVVRGVDDGGPATREREDELPQVLAS